MTSKWSRKWEQCWMRLFAMKTTSSKLTWLKWTSTWRNFCRFRDYHLTSTPNYKLWEKKMTLMIVLHCLRSSRMTKPVMKKRTSSLKMSLTMLSRAKAMKKSTWMKMEMLIRWKHSKVRLTKTMKKVISCNQSLLRKLIRKFISMMIWSKKWILSLGIVLKRKGKSLTKWSTSPKSWLWKTPLCCVIDANKRYHFWRH